jgi:hypothetical protein
LLIGHRTKSARVIFRCGKERDGYFTNEEILAQAESAMDILDEFYPNDEHIFIYDNATTHLMWPEDAVSTVHMPMKPVSLDKPNFGVKMMVDGVEKRVRMADGILPNGQSQSFYFSDRLPRNDPNYAYRGRFKGMKNIILERRRVRGSNLPDPSNLRAQCDKTFSKLKCSSRRTDCCLRRILFCQPDFVNAKSKLQVHCEKRGYKVIYLLKYHCELNPIESYWGYAKRVYQELPASSKDADLEWNVIHALDAVPLVSIRRFSVRCLRFMDAYRKGLNGAQAAWAGKKYRGQRMIPTSLLEDMDKENIERSNIPTVNWIFNWLK